jgi:nitrate/TMAO reductase-like tetraheme cytochrome c subunit
LCAILQAIQLILSLCIFLAIPFSKASYAFIIIAFLLDLHCVILLFFSFFSRVSKRKKANKNKNCQFCDSFQATSESVFREEAKKKKLE